MLPRHKPLERRGHLATLFRRFCRTDLAVGPGSSPASYSQCYGIDVLEFRVLFPDFISMWIVSFCGPISGGGDPAEPSTLAHEIVHEFMRNRIGIVARSTGSSRIKFPSCHLRGKLCETADVTNSSLGRGFLSVWRQIRRHITCPQKKTFFLQFCITSFQISNRSKMSKACVSAQKIPIESVHKSQPLAIQ
jgi:hypothetical protein